MAGDKQANSPKDFNECVSRAQLQAAMEESQRGMNDAIKKAVTDALIDLKLGSSIERLDRRISTLTDKVTELENRLPNEEDMGGNNSDEDALLAKLNSLKQGDNSVEAYYHNLKFHIKRCG